MSKKINIVGITVTVPGELISFNVGEGQPVVEKIIYEEYGYNKGKQGKFPAYILFMKDSNIRKIIKESAVTSFNSKVIDEKEVVIPDLPEGDDVINENEIVGG